MSKAEYWQRGEAIDFANNTEVAIEENEIVVLGTHVGVAGAPIGIGETGTLHVFGVFEMPKAEGEAIDAGSDVYYTDNAITATPGEVKVGYATEAAAAENTVIKVKLLS